jgi:hypothetical protein
LHCAEHLGEFYPLDREQILALKSFLAPQRL